MILRKREGQLEYVAGDMILAGDMFFRGGTIITIASKTEQRILQCLLLVYPKTIRAIDILLHVYPDPDAEPDWSYSIIKNRTAYLRKRLLPLGLTISKYTSHLKLENLK